MGSIEHNHVDVTWLNQMIRQTPGTLVEQAERQYEGQIAEVAGKLAAQQGEFSILLVSGPTASTKTTTAQKLAKRLGERSIHAVVVSLDDFFVNRDKIPREPDGSVDFESIRMLDIPHLHHCFDELLHRGASEFPLFDFKSGHRAEKTRPIHAGSDTIVIVEGIHALNPIIERGQDKAGFRRAYISPNSDYRLDGERVLRVRDVRLIRRIIRDYYHRSNSVQRTLEMWKGVIRSEADNIFPYRDEVDYIIDSAILYEPNVYRGLLRDILVKSAVTGEYADKVAELTASLAHFEPLAPLHIPAATVLHEFLE